jgi:DNA mismatch repair protein MutS2
MLYPLNSADKLGFTEVKELIKAHCLSVMGQEMVDKIQVMSNYDLICHKFLNQANEFKNILQNDAALPINNFYDIKSLANKARIEGSFLSEEEFFQVQASLTTVFAVIAYFSEREGIYPNLEALFEHLPIEKGYPEKDRSGNRS